jgi:hypothetical protein
VRVNLELNELWFSSTFVGHGLFQFPRAPLKKSGRNREKHGYCDYGVCLWMQAQRADSDLRLRDEELDNYRPSRLFGDASGKASNPVDRHVATSVSHQSLGETPKKVTKE